MSVGVTTVDPGGDYSHEHAVRHADLALYTIKARGRDGWSFREPAEAQAADAAPQLLKNCQLTRAARRVRRAQRQYPGRGMARPPRCLNTVPATGLRSCARRPILSP